MIGPLERLGHGSVVILDKGENPGLQILNRGKRAAFEQCTDQNTEPDLDLIEPGAMLGSVLEHDFMAGIAEKSSATGHRGEDTALAFDTQILLDA